MIKNALIKIKSNKFTFALSVFVVLLICISLGSAAITSILTINGKTKLKAPCWGSYFKEISNIDASHPNSDPALDARIKSNTSTGDEVEFSTTLIDPGDYYTFNVYTANDCDEDIVIESTELSGLSEKQKEYIDFTVLYDDQNDDDFKVGGKYYSERYVNETEINYYNQKKLNECDPLYGKTRRKIKVTVRYKKKIPDLEDDLNLNLSFKINYVQHHECNSDRKYILTIRPNGGKYENSKIEITKELSEGETIDLDIPIRNNYNFVNWEAVYPTEGGTFELVNKGTNEKSKFTMGHEDVTIQANYVTDDYVARIMNKYYTTIQAAFDDVDRYDWEDNTVWLLKNTTEYPTNNTDATKSSKKVPKRTSKGEILKDTDGNPVMVNEKAFVFNLDGHTVTGAITNSSVGDITLVNGTIKTENITENDANANKKQYALINNGTITLGEQYIPYGNPVEVENSISIIGNRAGLINNDGSKFYFYDGYLEGENGYLGERTGEEEGYYVIVEDLDVSEGQRVREYLAPTPNRSVARTTTGGTKYYYNLQNALKNSSSNRKLNSKYTDNDFIVYAIRDFEAAYPLSIKEDERVFFDLAGFNIETGESITNDGLFKIYNSDEVKSNINASVTITNNGNLEINNVNIKETTDSDVVVNKANLVLRNTTLQGKNSYGVKNTSNGTIDLDSNTILKSLENVGLYNDVENFNLSNGKIYGIYNDAPMFIKGNTKIYIGNDMVSYYNRPYAINNNSTLTMESGEVSDSSNTILIRNNDVFNLNGGTITSGGTAISNSKTFNGNGGSVTATETAVSGRTINVDGSTLTSTTGVAVDGYTITLNSGTITSTENIGIKSTDRTVTITGGTVNAGTIGVTSNVLNMTGGTINSDDIGVKTKTYTVSGWDTTTTYRGTVNLDNGTINGKNYGIFSDNIVMNNGNVISSEGTGILVNYDGKINGGYVRGDIYGIHNNAIVTIGIDDGVISSTKPEVVGGSYGLYALGNDVENNFNDGILKGQIDGYYERITGSPLGSVISEGTDVIDGNNYETDFVSRYEDWIRVGDNTYNSIDAACAAINSTNDTMVVYKDVKLTFKQHFLEGKTYKFDLAGHTIESTQPIYNDSTTTIIDSSEDHKGTFRPSRISILVNNREHELILNGGNYVSELEDVIDNSGLLTINNAHFNVKETTITNHKEVVINNIEIERSKIGIKQKENDKYKSGKVTMNGGRIYATEVGIQTSLTWEQSYGVEVNNGYIESEGDGISGATGNIIVNGGTILGKTGYGIASTSFGGMEINGGNVTSLAKEGAYGCGGFHMTGGTLTGATYGVRNYYLVLAIGGDWVPINIEGGTIIGKSEDGIYNLGSELTITGGYIEGYKDGVRTTSGSAHTIIGDNSDAISVESPVLVGLTNYGLETTAYTEFYDGILIGKEIGHKGIISLIPSGTAITESNRYLDGHEGIKYNAHYLEKMGDWLEVDGNPYNTLEKAFNAIRGTEGTIIVTKSAYVNFEQTIPSGKKVYLDLNGKNVITTQPIKIENNTTIIDSSKTNDNLIGEGSIHNVRDSVFEVESQALLTISEGSYSSDNSVLISNFGSLNIKNGSYYTKGYRTIFNHRGNVVIDGGTLEAENSIVIDNLDSLIINDGKLKGEMCVHTSSYAVINGGTLESKNSSCIESTGTLIVNEGTIDSESKYAIASEKGSLTINDGTITSQSKEAIVYGGSSNGNTILTVNGGTITGQTNGITSNSSGNTLFIKGGTITGLNGYGTNSNCESTITGGIIKGSTYGVTVTNSSSVTVLGDNDGKIDIESPKLIGDLYGLYISAGEVNFYDGILMGITDRWFGQISNIAPDTHIYLGEEDNYLSAFLVLEKEIAENLNKLDEQGNPKKYRNLNTAFEEAGSGDTLRLIDNAPIYYDVTNNNSGFTFDLNGYELSTNKGIVNNGDITITDTKGNGSLKTSSSINLITNNGELNITDVNIKNTSSAKYVIDSKNKLVIDRVNINAINGITNTAETTITNSAIYVTNGSGINTTNKLIITGGTYTSERSYAVYSNTNKDVEINNVTINGKLYTSGNNSVKVKNSSINLINVSNRKNAGTLVNYSNDLLVEKCFINELNNLGNALIKKSEINNNGIVNSGVVTLDDCDIINNENNNGKVKNSGTMIINDSRYSTKDGSTYTSDCANAFNNSGVLTINRSEITVNPTGSVRAFNNTGTLNILDETIVTVGVNTFGTIQQGVRNAGRGIVNIDNSNLYVVGGTNSYGIYSDSENAQANIVTGRVDVRRSANAYALYTDTGVIELGIPDGSGLETADVDVTDPFIYAQGTTKGIGVKKINGYFNFYDGIVWGSKYAKPETTSNVEFKYEATTYLDTANGWEYSILEWMGNDYEGDTVASINSRYYKSMQEAINDASDGDTIRLLKSITEEYITIPENLNVTINLNKHSITTTLTNNGNVTVFNGSLQNIDKTTVINNGTFIMGVDDNNISSTNPRIVSEATAIKNNGTFIMYDGYIEGKKAIDGIVNRIPEVSRLYVSSDSQSEKKFLQSLSEESIINGTTDLIITIDPNGGKYNNLDRVQEVYAKYSTTYTLIEPTKRGCVFEGWEIIGTEDITQLTEPNRTVIGVGLSDITVRAKWRVSENVVARINDEYYDTLQDAIDDANAKDKVVLLKDVREDITNKRNNISIDLGGHIVTGAFINQGIVQIENGTIYNPNGIGLDNRQILTLGNINDNVSENSVKIIGSTIGLQQRGEFNFYDGYLQGEIGLVGSVTQKPLGYFLYTEHDQDATTQRVYLIGNPENAVAETREGGTQYFFNLDDAIAVSSVTGYEIFIRRDFEASYELNIKEDADVVINLEGHNITAGNNIVVNGKLKIYDENETPGSISIVKAIDNKGDLTIDNVTINQISPLNGIDNSGSLTLNNATVSSTTKYAVNNTGTLDIKGNTELKASGIQALYNAQETQLKIKSGTIRGIENAGDIELSENTLVEITLSGKSAIICKDDSKLSMLGGTVKSSSIGINLSGSNSSFDMSGGEITTSGISINTSENNVVDIDISGGYIKSTEGNSINTNSTQAKKTVNITGVTFETSRYNTLNISNNTDISIKNAKIINKYTGNYAISCAGTSNCTIEEGTIIDASSTNNIYASGNVVINGGTFEVNASSKSVIQFNSGKLTINGGTFNANNSNSYCIRTLSTNVKTLTMNGGTLYSKYNTIDISHDKTTANIYGGEIFGDNYGLYLNHSGATLTIGNPEESLQTTQPLISGLLYGLYNKVGNVNFYSGKLRGVNGGYYGNVSEVRLKTEVTDAVELNEETVEYATSTTTNTSETPTSNYAKKGNGYAKFIYLGDTNETCENNHEYVYPYEGVEKTFTAPCTGKYKIEVWGAEGGSANASYVGGYGGYATGEISLIKDEVLYVNVGGQGTKYTGKSGVALGGYNGGGDATVSYSTSVSVASGGGATHVATVPGLLSTLENNKSAVIIVAAGGGGSVYRTSSYSGVGGSGGGYIGANGTNRYQSARYTTGGTQEGAGYFVINDKSKGSFGQGGTNESDTSDMIAGAGGAGWYGGGAGYNQSGNSSLAAGAGGSSYIGNSRLSNKVMYGYNVQNTIINWNVSYLSEKEAYLKVGDEQFNTFIDAIAAITNENKTITVLKDIALQESVTFPSDKEIIFDLNGHNITTQATLINEGNLTITNSVSNNNYIENTLNDLLINKGDLSIDKVILKAEANNTKVISGINEGSITITNSTINGYESVIVDNNQEIYIKDSTITGKSYTIYTKANNQKITIIDSNISTTGTSKYVLSCVGRLNDVNITGSTFNSESGAINIYSGSTTEINQINITDTIIEGKAFYSSSNYPLVSFYYGNAIISGGRIKNKTSSSYALYGGSSTTITLKDEVEVSALNKVGVYISGATLNVEDAQIITTSDGIEATGNNSKVNITGGSIDVSSKGINCGSGASISMIDGEINSTSYGIYSSSNGKVNVTGGTVHGDKYGILLVNDKSELTIGDKNTQLNNNTPIIEGGDYGVYVESGIFNFYNGLLKGKYNGYRDLSVNIRDKYSIYTEYNQDENIDTNVYTINTNSISDIPISETAKKGNGYARITYIGESNESCTNGTTYDFDYTGTEQTFDAPCAGSYKLETWGAQGGTYLNANRGYGGYSRGIIELTANEKLYINVGGKGTVADSLEVVAPGGYNGGGDALSMYTSMLYSGSGGGATHIATSSGLLSSLSGSREDIIIVAGGGGGNYYSSSSSYDFGGSGGGYVGGKSGKTSITTYVTGGTQSSGGYYYTSVNIGTGSFGQGSELIKDGSNRYGGAGGGGYYGGGASKASANGGGGGSGYTGNSRLTSSLMAVYSAEATTEMVSNYLTSEQGYLKVENNVYSSLEEALAAISSSGTITVLNNNTSNELVTIPSDKTITLNLNGKQLTMVNTIVNEGNLIINDSSNVKGTLNNPEKTAIDNKGNITISGGKVISDNNVVIEASSGIGNIIINNNSIISGDIGIKLDSKQNVTIENSRLESLSKIIDVVYKGVTIDISNSTLSSNYNGLYIRKEQANITLTNVNLNTMYESIKFETGSYNYRHILNIKDSNVENRFSDTIYTYYVDTIIDNSTLTNKVNNIDKYVFLNSTYSNLTIRNNSKLLAYNCSGIYNNTNVQNYGITIDNSEVKTDAISGYGIKNQTGSINVNTDGKITTTGSSSYGISSVATSYVSITFDGGEITSNNIGLNIGPNSGNNTYITANINNGRIYGATYGVNVYKGARLNIGNTTSALSIEHPEIEGGLYGVYKQSGNVYLYSGIIKGLTSAYDGYIDDMREGHTILQANSQLENIKNIKTISTEESSENPMIDTAKEGNGYAKITYLGESNETCENNHEYEFSYLGREQVFNTPCTGKYKLETWGAQGGTYNDAIGGYGGYSVGEIDLTVNEKLYVNVGGMGKVATDSNPESGGYNGGGEVTVTLSTYRVGTGGGATHIATRSGLLSSLENNKDSVIIVSGGGSGMIYYNSSNKVNGASAGGYIGSNGISSTNNVYYGTGGTQISGGYNKNDSTTGRGSFGHGGHNVKSNSSYYASAGGSGWYGGGGAQSSGYNSGGGGSGYIGNSRLTNAHMSGYQAITKENDTSIKIAYLVELHDFVKNIDTGVSYSDIQTAINAATSGQTLQLLEDNYSSDTLSTGINTDIIIDLHGHNLYLLNTFENNGTLKITNSDNNNESNLVNISSTLLMKNNYELTVEKINIQSYKFIENYVAADLKLDDIKVNSTEVAINNNGKISVDNSEITSSNSYAIYENSSIEYSMDHVKLNGSSYSLYMNTGNKITITNSELIGRVTNTKGTGNLIITSSNITGAISNSGTSKIKNSTMYSEYNSGSYNSSIYTNTGTLTLEGNNITIKELSTNSYITSCLKNSGRLTSTSNTYLVKSSNDNSNSIIRHFRVIDNTGILNSTSDNLTINNSGKGYGIYNNSDNEAEVINLTTNINRKGSAYDAFGVYNAKGNLNISSNTIGVTTQGVGYGIYVNAGNVTLTSGTVNVNGTTVYGIYVNAGTFTLGIQDGSGTDDADVSITDPLIIATGTTNGYGIERQNGNFNYYDGKIMGTTLARTATAVTSGSERNYQIYTADENGYNYCILKFIK